MSVIPGLPILSVIRGPAALSGSPGVLGCSGDPVDPGPLLVPARQSDGVSGKLCRPGGQTDLLVT